MLYSRAMLSYPYVYVAPPTTLFDPSRACEYVTDVSLPSLSYPYDEFRSAHSNCPEIYTAIRAFLEENGIAPPSAAAE
jgi:hypothetical protein